MFYYVGVLKRGLIKIIRDSNETEVKKIEELLEPVKKIISHNNRIVPLQKAFGKISAINTALLCKNEEYDVYDLNEAVSAYLFRLRKFLDNWETYLKQNHGESSIHYLTFKQATKDAYDNNPEYQIVYQLRNADQHCDNIVTNVRMGIEPNGTRYIQAIARCEYLLTMYKKWKSGEKQHLETQTEIDIFQYIEKANKCVTEIHRKTVNSFCSKDLYENCYKVIAYSNEFLDDREDLVFFCQEEELTKEYMERETQNLKPSSWMVDTCIRFLIKYMRNNISFVSVIYRGAFAHGHLEEYAIKLDKEGKEGYLSIGEIVKINDVDYRCHANTIDLCRDANTVVAVNAALPREKGKEIGGQIARFVDALVWNGRLNEST